MKSFLTHCFACGQLPSVTGAHRLLRVCATLALAGLLPALLVAQSPAPAPTVSAQPTPPVDTRPETVISSDELDMVGGDEANHFYFRGNVKVQATNMLATCDELEVIAARQSAKKETDKGSANATVAGVPSATASSVSAPNATASSASPTNATAAAAASAAEATSAPVSEATSAPAAKSTATNAAPRAAGSPDIGSIREIIMRGNVVISQEGRRATAGTAYLYPQEGRVVLADNPLVTDAQGTLSGWRMELYRGERKVRILSNPDETQRTRVTLPALQDLGYGEAGAPGNSSGTASTADPGTATEGQPPLEGTQPATTTTGTAPAAGTVTATGGAIAAGEKTATGASVELDRAASQKDESPEPVKPRRGSGWNPVNAPRR